MIKKVNTCKVLKIVPGLRHVQVFLFPLKRERRGKKLVNLLEKPTSKTNEDVGPQPVDLEPSYSINTFISAVNQKIHVSPSS